MRRIFFLLAILSVAVVASADTYKCVVSADEVFPVRLLDSTDLKTPETGKAFGDTTIYYKALDAGGGSASTYTDDATTFLECDGTNLPGDYELKIGASEFTTNGARYIVRVVVSGCADYEFIVETVAQTAYNQTADVNAILDDTGSSGVIVVTNNDKAGYTASTVSDKTGYSLAADQSGVTIGTVNALAANTITSAAIQDGAITDAKVANDVQVDVLTIETGDASDAINAECVDVLATDTYVEPGQGAPAATLSLSAKINYLYKAWRNKKTQTSSEFDLFADDASTVDQKATVSDNGTTTTVGEIGSGP